MGTFKRILFPTDFSGQSRAVVPAVKTLARRFGAEVIVLHVVDLPPAWFGSPEASAWAALIDANRLREAGRVALDRFIGDQFSDLAATPELSEGDAARLIVECATDDRADLIMMPTRGYGPFRAMLLGSVTAKVLHDAHCPVWTGVHAEQMTAHPADRWKRMLCALDADPRDLGLLRWAAAFAAEQGMELRLVHAVRSVSAMLAREDDNGRRESLFQAARDQIAKMQAQVGTRFELCLLGGSAGRAVHQAAVGHDADLIVTGRGAIQKTLGQVRSSAYSVIREASCPVISILT